VTPATGRYVVVLSPITRRQLTENLPESVAAAAKEFMVWPLLDHPDRAGNRLHTPLED
jgi:mRNA interferase RelE/StbE